MANRYDNKVMSVSKALTILETLSKASDGLGLLEISAKVGMNKTTVYRLLTSLMEKKFVIQDQIDGKYSLGIKILGLAGSFYENIDVRVVVKNHLIELQDINLLYAIEAKEVNGEYLVLNTFHLGKAPELRIGEVLERTCVCGKVFLANQMLWKYNNKPFFLTEESDWDSLRQELKVIALQGYGIDKGIETNLPCIAVPVFNYAKNVECVIGAFSQQINSEVEWKNLLQKLLIVSKRISKDLGFEGI